DRRSKELAGWLISLPGWDTVRGSRASGHCAAGARLLTAPNQTGPIIPMSCEELMRTRVEGCWVLGPTRTPNTQHLFQGENALLAVVARVVHEGADREGDHRLGGIRPQERLNERHFLHRRVEPEVEVGRIEDDRHPVMDRAHQLVGGG